MRGRAALAAVLAALVAPAAAGAQDVFEVSGLPGGKETTATATLSGSLTVEFHSDPATCGAAGRCGLQGTVSWRPPRRAQLELLEHRRRLDAYLFSLGSDRGALVTSARVQRSGAASGGLCADGGAGTSIVEFAADPGAVTFGLGSSPDTPDVLATRCAGPLLADLRGLLPRRRVSVATLRRGPVDVDLGGEAPFAAAGFAGTVRSDVKLHVAKPRRARQRSVGHLPGTRIERQRTLESEYRVERTTGSIRVDVRGVADRGACAPLDACGLTGAHLLTPAASGDVSFYAVAPATRSRRALEQALGLAPGRAPAGIESYGSGLLRDHGHDDVSIGRPGEAPCTDRAPVNAEALLLSPGRRTLHASLLPYADGGAALRSHCPGLTVTGPLATATLPLSALRHERLTLRLRTGVTVGGDGVTAHSHPDLTIVLRRTRVRERIFRQPVPVDEG